MTTLADFHSEIRAAINRGSIYDTQIASATRRAARWIERNYTLAYMRRYVAFSLNPDAVEPRAVAFPARVKSIYFMAWRGDAGADGTYELNRLQAFHPGDMTKVEKGDPTGYWLDGNYYIWFDRRPDKARTVEMSYAEYTSWPTDTSQSPWLVENGEDALMGQTMLYLAPEIRMDQEMIAAYKAMRDEGLKTLVDAEAELFQDNSSAEMRYQ